MSDEKVVIDTIISIASGTGFWVREPRSPTGASNPEFFPVAFWLAAVFVWSNGDKQQRTVPISINDVAYVRDKIDVSQEVILEWFNYEVFHDSYFSVVGETLKPGLGGA